MRRIFASSMALALPLFLFGSLGPASNGAETRLGPATAHAIDLFGSDEADAEEEAWPGAFWRSESGIGKAKPAGIPTSFADLAERVAPAVVSIQTRETVRFDAFLTPGHPRGFGLPPMPRGPGGREFEQEGQGSGFVVSTDGYIVTNNHVVEAAEEITVRFLGGRELPAAVVGLDPKTDIALLKVEPGDEDLTTIALGDSEAIRPGDWVVAIGNPFGLEHTVTAGIVSATHRRDLSEIVPQSYHDYIQTDAAINPGNSGGPLIDLEGRVVGINTRIRAEANTLGFSVPINMAKQILPSLRAEGRATRGWLGVALQPITRDLADAFGLEQPRGALIGSVFPESPAEAGGLERGDVIIAFDGERIDDVQSLRLVVAATPVDKVAKVVVIRDTEKETLRVKTGRLDDGPQMSAVRGPNPPDEGFGMRVRDANAEDALRLGLEGEVEGVVVVDVDPGGPAAKSDVRPGDIIVELDRKAVADVDDLVDQLEEADRPLLLVRRGSSTLWIRLTRAG
ncbi:MAG: Do family serine endopeptidase [Myxococcota bacterium]